MTSEVDRVKEVFAVDRAVVAIQVAMGTVVVADMTYAIVVAVARSVRHLDHEVVAVDTT